MSCVRSFAYLLASLLVLVATMAPAIAQGTYRVDGIAVEATAADAVQARTIALEQGQRDGLRQLLERLAGEAAPSTTDLPLDGFVTNFEVLSETIGPSSYAGTLAVSYDRSAIEELLDRRGVAFAREQAEPVTLVPLWELGTGLRLWEGDNAWRQAWDAALDPQGLAVFVVPLGDLQDLSLLDAEQAVRGDQTAMLALAARYGTEGVVLARLIGSGEPGASLDVRATGYGTAGGLPYQAVVRRSPGETLEQSLERAVREMQRAFDARARQEAVATTGPATPLVVTTEVTSLESWGRLLQYLEGLGGVEVENVRSFSREEAILGLRVAGGAERLTPELERSGWFLRRDAEGGWRLQQGGGPGVVRTF